MIKFCLVNFIFIEKLKNYEVRNLNKRSLSIGINGQYLKIKKCG